MNRVRRLAEELVTRYPALFSGDFDKNKQALSKVAVVRNRALRNELAGAITKIIHERGPDEGKPSEEASVLQITETTNLGSSSEQKGSKEEPIQQAEKRENASEPISESSAGGVETSSQSASPQQ